MSNTGQSNGRGGLSPDQYVQQPASFQRRASVASTAVGSTHSDEAPPVRRASTASALSGDTLINQEAVRAQRALDEALQRQRAEQVRQFQESARDLGRRLKLQHYNRESIEQYISVQYSHWNRDQRISYVRLVIAAFDSARRPSPEAGSSSGRIAGLFYRKKGARK